MKQKTSVTLSEDLVRELDRLAGRGGNRSKVIEDAVIFFLTAKAKDKREKQMRVLIDKHADALAKEALDVLAYQVEI